MCDSCFKVVFFLLTTDKLTLALLGHFIHSLRSSDCLRLITRTITRASPKAVKGGLWTRDYCDSVENGFSVCWTWPYTYWRLKPGSQCSARGCVALHCVIVNRLRLTQATQRKDRIEVYPCVRCVAVDQSDRTK